MADLGEVRADYRNSIDLTTSSRPPQRWRQLASSSTTNGNIELKRLVAYHRMNDGNENDGDEREASEWGRGEKAVKLDPVSDFVL